ncbi:DNase I-like protein, partial [Trametes sanguinea]
MAGVSDKWLCINQLMRERHLTILAVQEPHLTPERLLALQTLFSDQLLIHSSPHPDNPSGAGGIALVISTRRAAAAIPPPIALIPGRALVLDYPWSASRTLRILAVYAPNAPAENAAFWLHLRDLTTTPGFKRPDILLGDFNVVEDANDRLPAHPDSTAATAALAALLQPHQLLDSWRNAHPSDRAYTFNQLGRPSHSRIDRIYVRSTLQSAAADWSTSLVGLVTDHALVSLSLANYQTPSIGPGRWSLPPLLLTDKPFLDTMRDLVMSFQHDLLTSGPRTATSNPQTLFYGFKTKLVAAARARAK